MVLHESSDVSNVVLKWINGLLPAHPLHIEIQLSLLASPIFGGASWTLWERPRDAPFCRREFHHSRFDPDGEAVSGDSKWYYGCTTKAIRYSKTAAEFFPIVSRVPDRFPALPLRFVSGVLLYARVL